MSGETTALGKSPGALTGVTVLNLTTVTMWPFGTCMLGGFGTEVVKVETLDGDNPLRMRPERSFGMMAPTLGLQRNEPSISVDLKAAEGQQFWERLARESDVVVSNLRPQSRERRGISYPALGAVRGDVISYAARAYAEDCNRGKGYDDVMQTVSVLTGLVEAVEDTPHYAPDVVADADKINGLTGDYFTSLPSVRMTESPTRPQRHTPMPGARPAVLVIK